MEERRAITYQMSKNKGLQPKRKKEQRNPRVKHRKKFEKAKVRRKGKFKNGILFPNLFWPTVTKSCSSDGEKLLKFEAEGREFEKILRSLEQFIQTVKGQNNFW